MFNKWLLYFFGISLLILFFVLCINFVVDPYQQYRKATFYKPYFSNERYLNPGIAKTYNYDSVVIGSSMTENFRLSNIKTQLGFSKPIKFTIAGASARDIKIIMDVVNTKNTKNILFGLDIYALYGSTHRLSNPLPMYLYDNNIFNDYKYLINIDVLKADLVFLIANLIKKDDPKMQLDTMYQWQHKYNHAFGQDNVFKHYNKIKNITDSFGGKEYKYELFKKNFIINILPIIERFPEANFYIFFPPYSIVNYKGMYEKKWLNDYLRIRKYIYERLSSYPNVELYDFQVADTITHNLSNYKDMTHYHQKINLWMLNQIKNCKYKINNKNQIENNNKKILKEVNQYKINNEE